jgi:hypothetical protein
MDLPGFDLQRHVAQNASVAEGLAQTRYLEQRCHVDRQVLPG